MIAIDYGTGNALVMFSPRRGHMKKRDLGLIRVPGGQTDAGEFVRCLEYWFSRRENVVVESATIGSSGVEAVEVQKVCDKYPKRTLWVISNRAVKNFRMDNKIPPLKSYWKHRTEGISFDSITDQITEHQQAAEIIHYIASKHKARLKKWKMPSDRLIRKNKSVRPYDKRKYRGPVIDTYFATAPDYNDLPDDLKELLGDGKQYNRARVLPLLQALEEDGSETRSGYEKILGMYDHGYPSYYRRAVHDLACVNAGTSKSFKSVDWQTRKDAYKKTRRQIRHFYHLCT